MAQVKGSGNKSTELKIAAILRREGLKGWRRNSQIRGKPDFVYPKHKIAIFIDGCFWHGCPRCCRIPNTRKEYWIAKIERNMHRDKIVNRDLRKSGWKVMRIWEHEIDKPALTKKLKKLKSMLSNGE